MRHTIEKELYKVGWTARWERIRGGVGDSVVVPEDSNTGNDKLF